MCHCSPVCSCGCRGTQARLTQSAHCTQTAGHYTENKKKDKPTREKWREVPRQWLCWSIASLVSTPSFFAYFSVSKYFKAEIWSAHLGSKQAEFLLQHCLCLVSKSAWDGGCLPQHGIWTPLVDLNILSTFMENWPWLHILHNPTAMGYQQGTDWEKGTAFIEELEKKRGWLCLVGTCFFPLMLADKSLPSRVPTAGVYRAAVLWALLPM